MAFMNLSFTSWLLLTVSLVSNSALDVHNEGILVLHWTIYLGQVARLVAEGPVVLVDALLHSALQVAEERPHGIIAVLQIAQEGGWRLGQKEALRQFCVLVCRSLTIWKKKKNNMRKVSVLCHYCTDYCSCPSSIAYSLRV